MSALAGRHGGRAPVAHTSKQFQHIASRPQTSPPKDHQPHTHQNGRINTSHHNNVAAGGATGRRRPPPRRHHNIQPINRTPDTTSSSPHHSSHPNNNAAVFAATVDTVQSREPRHGGRAAHRRLQGRRRVARDDLRGPARRVEPQSRNGRAAAARGAPVGRLRPLALGARPGQGRRPRDQVGAHPRHGGDGRRGAQRAHRPARRRRRHRDAWASTSGRVRSTCPSLAGGRPRSSTRFGPTRRRWASRTSRPGRSCAPAITPAPESITWSARPPDRLAPYGRAVCCDQARSRRVVGGAAAVLRRHRAER